MSYSRTLIPARPRHGAGCDQPLILSTRDLGVLDPRSRPAAGTARTPGFQQDQRGATSAPSPGGAELSPSREHSLHPSLSPDRSPQPAFTHADPPAAENSPLARGQQPGVHLSQTQGSRAHTPGRRKDIRASPHHSWISGPTARRLQQGTLAQVHYSHLVFDKVETSVES